VRVALFNPPWSFEGSIYFGCREPHLPLEYGYAKCLLERAGHDVLLLDAHLGFAWDRAVRDAGDPHAALEAFRPDVTAVTTAPSYLFWRCAPPELRVPMRALAAVRDVAGRTVAVGPHASTTPGATLKKLCVDAAVMGECEEVLVSLASTPPDDWAALPHVATPGAAGGVKPHACNLGALPALVWPREVLARHAHHHHRFDRAPDGPGGELEASRGCPYHCTFCAKDNFRDSFRKRPLEAILAELDAMLERGVRYVYFVDEIFVPDGKLLDALTVRDVAFGVQMRIDNWSRPMLVRLGQAGCVSIEAGMESVTHAGRSLLGKRCKLSTEELTSLLVYAKQRIPFVQANLLGGTADPKDAIAAWRAYLHERGVWANDPVPLFPYPGSPEYTLRFGAADDLAWERAHEHYLREFAAFSDIQETRPLPLAELEGPARSQRADPNENEGPHA
jgi:B12-binding domain/radical SAM domain protein of rhizo-twelve system